MFKRFKSDAYNEWGKLGAIVFLGSAMAEATSVAGYALGLVVVMGLLALITGSRYGE